MFALGLVPFSVLLGLRSVRCIAAVAVATAGVVSAVPASWDTGCRYAGPAGRRGRQRSAGRRPSTCPG